MASGKVNLGAAKEVDFYGLLPPGDAGVNAASVSCGWMEDLLEASEVGYLGLYVDNLL